MLQSMAVAEQGCEPQHDPRSEQWPMVTESSHVGPSPAGRREPLLGVTPAQPSGIRLLLTKGSRDTFPSSPHTLSSLKSLTGLEELQEAHLSLLPP